MSDQPATTERTRRQSAVRRAIAASAVVASLTLTVVAIAAPSPAIALLLSACGVATGALVAGRANGALLARRVHRRRRRGPISPRGRRALAEFRRELDALPETTHPIGL